MENACINKDCKMLEAIGRIYFAARHVGSKDVAGSARQGCILHLQTLAKMYDCLQKTCTRTIA
ncbi:MAG: hypothetical protein IJI68_03545 [Eggerthellaceae bacterium]|nr:hypothetical protein [Eggerthellaceae bacterium]